jgi:energy-coupling factor transporter ATP-binding protein EcfA2
MAIKDIAKSLNISRQIITIWKKKYKWSDWLNDITLKVKEKLGEDLSEVKTRQAKICKLAQSKYVEALRDAKTKVTGTDAVNFMKQELLLIGEATERVDSSQTQDLYEKMKQFKKEIDDKKE